MPGTGTHRVRSCFGGRPTARRGTDDEAIPTSSGLSQLSRSIHLHRKPGTGATRGWICSQNHQLSVWALVIPVVHRRSTSWRATGGTSCNTTLPRPDRRHPKSPPTIESAVGSQVSSSAGICRNVNIQTEHDGVKVQIIRSRSI